MECLFETEGLMDGDSSEARGERRIAMVCVTIEHSPTNLEKR